MSCQRWRQNGQLHRPCIEQSHSEKSCNSEQLRSGHCCAIFRQDLPASIRYFADGAIAGQTWYQNGKVHREQDLAASIQYRENGSVSSQGWYQNNQRHRSQDLPAWIYYRENGSVRWQKWYQNGFLHREQDLPAFIEHYRNGSTFSQWYLRDIFQRESVCYPEPLLEDLVKPAFSLRENSWEPAFACNANGQEPVSIYWETALFDEE